MQPKLKFLVIFIDSVKVLAALNFLLVRHAFIDLYSRSWTLGRCLHQTWTVLILLYGRRGYRDLFWMLCFQWLCTEREFRWIQGEDFVHWCVSERMHLRAFALHLSWDVYWTSMSILDFPSNILDVCEAFHIFMRMWDTLAFWEQCLHTTLTFTYLIWKSI